jgi:site-specific DNA-methyltransferase (adenine-specific)/modification methylase
MRTEVIGDCQLYLGDCREILPTLSGIDAIVTDPPYGIAYDPTTYDGKFTAGVRGDESAFDPSPLLAIRGEKIIWGANNFADRLPRGGWYCWDKRCSKAADKILGSPFELAWTTAPRKFRMARILHAGKLNADGNDARREHPTQKPVALMAWCIDQLDGSPQRILDPFMGSGTTGVACAKMGRKFVGIEIDPVHFDIACKRLDKVRAQPDLFIRSVAEQEQLSLLA